MFETKMKLHKLKQTNNELIVDYFKKTNELTIKFSKNFKKIDMTILKNMKKSFKNIKSFIHVMIKRINRLFTW